MPNILADNKLFQKLIENSYSGITLLDKNLSIIYRSPSAERIGGWKREELSPQSLNNLTHPEDLEIVNQTLNKALGNPGLPVNTTFRTKHAGGHFIWIEATFTNLLQDTDVNGIVCNFRDVTLQKETEIALQRSIHELSDYKYALDESAIVAITDQKGLIKHVNDNFCKISKYSREELIGQDHRIINSSYHDKAFIKSIWITIANGKIWKGELRNKAKDGNYYWVDTTIVPFLNEEGKPYQYIAIRSDITERKVRQQKIVENSRFIKTISDNLPAMMAYWTADLHCSFANKPLLDWFEMKPEQMHGISKQALFGPLEFASYEPFIKDVLKGVPQSFERTFVKENGKTIYTYTQYLPDIQGDSIKGFYSLIHDITEVKLAERALKKQTEQTEHLLESITDGFFGLDENMCFTYVNNQLGKIIGMAPDALLGKHIWDIFPDATGMAVYSAIQSAFANKKFIVIEDYYPALNLWHETRIYPVGTGLSIFIRDITKRVKEEHHLRLLESVITHTSDSIMITEAEPFDEPGPRIIYVNDAFTKMTGYTAEEVVGKTPRLLQGPKTDKEELNRLKESLQNWQTTEITTINYKKSGEAFWNNFSVVPVADEKGWYTHWIAVERDISQRKHEELQKELLAATSAIFNQCETFNEALDKVLEKIAIYGNFVLCEFWLVDTDKKRINLSARYTEPGKKLAGFYDETAGIRNLEFGEGFAGICWSTQQLLYWNYKVQNKNFKRLDAALKAGLKRAYAVPLEYNGKVIGALALLMERDEEPSMGLSNLFNNFTRHLGAEINRKQLEQELDQIFKLAPDVICVAGVDGYFKKINPALCTILEYAEQELLQTPLVEFVFTEDRDATLAQFSNIDIFGTEFYVENRLVTKSGKIKWLAWTAKSVMEEGLIFCVAKDITEKKELEALLNEATTLARIGSWEVDLIKQTVYWSAITKEILQVDKDFEPTIELGINLYKEGEHRNTVIRVIQNAIAHGTPWDEELEVQSPAGITKWVRVIGDAEFVDGACIRLYGSNQDIDVRKKAELQMRETLIEKNTILESIADAFFAVDKNWVVTYWNKVAEDVLGKSKKEMLNNNLWEIFADAVNSESYKNYFRAMKRQEAAHFEDYYAPLQKWYEVSAYPSDRGLSVYFKDVTERKLYHQELMELNNNLKTQTKELAISNAELEQFAYVASHDLQEPLRMVTSFLTQLERKYNNIIDDKGRQYIHFAVDGAKRMRQIILDLLEFSRVGKIEDKLQEIDANIIIEEISALYRKQIEDKRAKIEYDSLPVLRAYKTSLRQVFQNLISNSLKYSKASINPIINIGCIDLETHLQFFVSDNGIGIDAEYYDRIFIIFQRLHNKNEYSGTGMGLAVTKKIIESMGGKIWVESEDGKGSTFYFTISKKL